MSIVETRNLTYKYSAGMPDEKTAVSNISVSFERGEIVGIIGPTGSGKSTFTQHLNGLLKPTSGEVLIDGVDIWSSRETLRDCRFKVGLVFQYPEYQLFEETIFKDVAFGPTNMGLSNEEIRDRVISACSFVGIGENMLERSPFDLSGGQKRRVAIAGVLAMNPEVLILDEPTAGLDPAGCSEILGEIAAYHKKQDGTVIIISHSMDDIASLANRVMVINNGSLFSFDTMSDTFKRASELEEMGLSIPAATSVMLELSRRGHNVDPSVYTTSDAAAQLISLLVKKGGSHD